METHSPQINELAVALAKAQGQLKPAAKDSTNPHFRSQYADLQSIWRSALPVLEPNGLSIAQGFIAGDGETVSIWTLLMHKSGQWIKSTLTLKPTKPDPQGIGSACTYGKRYGLSAILGIVADEDDDGNGASGNPSASMPRQDQTRATTPPKQQNPATAKETGKAGTPTSWRDVIVPPFIKAYKGKKLSEMLEKDLLWWAANYQPKAYQGEIRQADIDFRFALTQAKLELDGRDIEQLPPRESKEQEEARANVSKAKPDDDVPY